MPAPRWAVDRDGNPHYISVVGWTAWVRREDIFIGARSLADRDDAHAALARCVRDAETLAKARALAAAVDVDAALPAALHTSELGALLDLLTGDPAE